MRSTRPPASWAALRGKFRGTTLAHGLVGSWNFTERNGALIRDAVSGRHAVMGAPASWAPNPFGGAGGAMKGVLSTTNSGARVPYHPDFDCTRGVTMSCLFQMGVTTNQFMAVVSKPFTTTITDPYQEYSIYVKDNAHLELRVNSSAYETGAAYSAGQLIHAIFTVDGVRFKQWVNGTLEADNGDTRLPVNTNSQDLFFGQAATTENFDGTIKLVELWNRGFTDDEARFLTRYPYGVPQASRSVYMRALAGGGGGDVEGDVAITGSGGTVAAEGTTVVGGAVAITGSGGSVAATGTTNVAGTVAISGSGGTVAATGTTNVEGEVAIDGSGATLEALGNVVLGTVAIDGSGGAVAAEGAPVVSGAVAITGSGGAVAAAGTTNVAGAVAITGSGGTVAAAGTTNVEGTVAITGSGGTIAATGEGAEVSTDDDDMFLTD